VFLFLVRFMSFVSLKASHMHRVRRGHMMLSARALDVRSK
jgi:hypothetical protein